MYAGQMSSSPRRRNLLEQRVERILAQSPGQEDPSDLAERVQSVLACVPPEARSLISERTGRSLAEVEAIMESDPSLTADPNARHRVTICTGKTCARRGGAALLRRARQKLEAKCFETSPDGAVYLEPFRCFGQCAMAPNIRIDGGVRGAMTSERFELLLDMLSR